MADACQTNNQFQHTLSVKSVECHAELLLPAITRVAGIIGGVLLSLVLSVLLWPKSASEQAMRYAHLTKLSLL